MKKALLTVFSVLFLDQVSKILVKTTMLHQESFKVFGNWFLIHFIENPGMAFGIEFGGESGKLILSFVRIIVAAMIGFYIFQQVKKNAHPGYIFSLALIFSGAIGNIIDSAVYGLVFDKGLSWNGAYFEDYSGLAVIVEPGNGYGRFLYGNVVDMLHFPLIRDAHWPEWVPLIGGDSFEFFRPIFNIADSAISIGIFLIFIRQKKFFPKELSEQEEIVQDEIQEQVEY